MEEYQNGSIKVYNKETKNYEQAKPLLRRIIEEKNLNISLNYKSGNEKNTRALGNAIIQAIKDNKNQ